MLKSLGLCFKSVTLAAHLPQIIQNPVVPFALRTQSCKLLRAVYVDRDPFQRIGKPLRTRIWTGAISPDAGETNHVQQARRPQNLNDLSHLQAADELQHLKTALLTLLTEFGRGSPQQSDQDPFVAQLVTTLSLLMELGFFHMFTVANSRELRPNFSEMRQIPQPLMVLLEQVSVLCVCVCVCVRVYTFACNDGLLEQEAQAWGAAKRTADWDAVSSRNVAIIDLFHLFLDFSVSGTAISSAPLFPPRFFSTCHYHPAK